MSIRKVNARELTNISPSAAASIVNGIVEEIQSLQTEIKTLRAHPAMPDLSGLRSVILTLNQRVLDLQRALSEVSVTQTAVIQSLKELVPGFESKFEQACTAGKIVSEDNDRAGIAALEAELDRMK